MKTFIQRIRTNILGVLHGFDRIRFRGTRRFLAIVAGMMGYLWQRQVLLKDFKAFAANITAEVRQAAEEVASKRDGPSNTCTTVSWTRRPGHATLPSGMAFSKV